MTTLADNDPAEKAIAIHTFIRTRSGNYELIHVLRAKPYSLVTSSLN